MMKITMSTPGLSKEETFPMYAMRPGQVCLCIAEDYYVLCIQHGSLQPKTFLVLGDHGEANTYGEACPALVRKLYPGESVTIKFS